MRVLNGRDYYDTASTFGVDTTHVFERRGNVVKMKKPLTLLERPQRDLWFVNPKKGWREKEATGYYVLLRRVYFCGKAYDYVILKGKSLGFSFERRHDSFKIVDTSKYFYTWDELKEFLKEEIPEGYALSLNPYLAKADSLPELRVGDIKPKELEYLIENQITIATYDGDDAWLIDSDNLKDIHFGKVLSATEAFQQIDQWKFGTLKQDAKEMVNVSDAVKIHKHGFDEKSFRKGKQK